MEEQRDPQMSAGVTTHVAPIVMFVFNRLFHTQQTVEALQRNDLAEISELFVFSDGPRTAADTGKIEEVRAYLRAITGFKRVTVIARERNLGCARSIVSGITEIVNQYGRVVVVEDDIVTAPHFLRYINEALTLYQDDDQVACIHGYMYPVGVALPETFFIQGADIWGWGTWKRAWDLYEFDARKHLDQIKSRNLTKTFDFDGSFGYAEMLEYQSWGIIDTWDVQWYASAFLHGKLTLYPGKSLVANIGFDSSGTHGNTSQHFDVEISPEPVRLERIAIKENPEARAAIARFLRGLTPGFGKRVMIKGLNRIRAFWHSPRHSL